MASQPSDSERSALIGEICQITGTNPQTAAAFLEENQWDVNAAMSAFYANMDADSDDGQPASSGTTHQPPASSSQPSVSRSSQPGRSSNPAQKSKFGTLRDLQGGNSNDDDESDKEQEYFAGGDKSALAVQDPSNNNNSAADHIRRLMDTARRNGPPPPEEQPRSSRFAGQGQTLGGDDVESRIIPDPRAASARPPPMVERTLHLWADGFSVDDGPLYRYDDPNNRRILNMINAGSAPLEIMNVESGQAVDVKLEAHKSENYVAPKKKYAPFGGSGQRLGSPTPGATTQSTPTVSAAAAVPSSSAASRPTVEVDESQPTLSLQIRLADGTRLPSRFNTGHTIGDVYDFVDRAGPSNGRVYTLATTFPTKELTDKAQVLGEMAEFKRGGVVVQKWA